MPKNKHAQYLGRLSGAKKTEKEMAKLAKKRWDITPEERAEHGRKVSERMTKYWIGWREAKEQKKKAIKDSVKKAFKMN